MHHPWFDFQKPYSLMHSLYLFFVHSGLHFELFFMFCPTFELLCSWKIKENLRIMREEKANFEQIVSPLYNSSFFLRFSVDAFRFVSFQAACNDRLDTQIYRTEFNHSGLVYFAKTLKGFSIKNVKLNSEISSLWRKCQVRLLFLLETLKLRISMELKHVVNIQYALHIFRLLSLFFIGYFSWHLMLLICKILPGKSLNCLNSRRFQI